MRKNKMSNEALAQLIDHIGDGELNKAQDMFSSILQDKQSKCIRVHREYLLQDKSLMERLQMPKWRYLTKK